MAQNIIQINNNTIFFDDTLFKVNAYDEQTARIDIVRISNNVIVCHIYNGIVHWKTPPLAAAVVAQYGGVKITLT
jgi:hypothetical protein